MSEIPEVFAMFEQKLAHVLSFTIIAQRNNTKQAIEELLAYFSGIVERASKAEARIAELEMKIRHNALWQASEDAEERAYLEKLVPDLKKRIAELEAELKITDELLKEATETIGAVVACCTYNSNDDAKIGIYGIDQKAFTRIDQFITHYNDAISAGKVSVDVKRELSDAEITRLENRFADTKACNGRLVEQVEQLTAENKRLKAVLNEWDMAWLTDCIAPQPNGNEAFGLDEGLVLCARMMKPILEETRLLLGKAEVVR